MSRTLFWYVLRDLLKFFFMASGAVAGIMSFGALLRPLTQNGLDASQVVQILSLLMPAMTAYSLPVAALFATTMVYGRLSADNEIVACRASGISYGAIATPACMLGLVVAILNLLCLCFVVPAATLKVEKVIYSNMARLVQNKIERTHQIRIPGKDNVTVFAQEAWVPETPGPDPEVQQVILSGPLIVTYDQTRMGQVINGQQPPRQPQEFWMASKATAYITQKADDQLELQAVLENGVKFPRKPTGGMQAGVETTQFGPVPMRSPLEENTKFMDIWHLKALAADLGLSRSVQLTVADFITNEQRVTFLNSVMAGLNGPLGRYSFQSDTETFVVTRGAVKAHIDGDKLIIPSLPGAENRQVRFQQERNGRANLTVDTRQVELRARPMADVGKMAISMDLYDALVDAGDLPSPRANFQRGITVAMPDAVKVLQARTPAYYRTSKLVPQQDRERLRRQLMELASRIQGEMNMRCAFAVSCLALVMVGCALGMMFRSGNFLSAFALSFVPALLTIALIVTGQHICEGASAKTGLGLSLMWGALGGVALLGTVLLGRLHRT